MDPLELVKTTADAAFATDKKGQIVAWNAAVERLLGHTAAGVMGRHCSDVLCGIDVFGNPYCSRNCVLLESALRRVPLRRFELRFKTPCGEYVPVTISTMRVPNSDPQGANIMHMMHPVDAETGAAPCSGNSVEDNLPALTAREAQVLRLVSEGHTIAEIAQQLRLGATTIRTHLRNVRAKLAVRSTLEAACVALRNGLI